MARRYFNESNVKPGVISDELREALDLNKKSLPIWIHRMRILGYPPGWLKKADMTNTTINFIDDNEENDIEDGQVDTNINPYAEKKYNTDSFFEYPGFNSPVPKGVKDDYEKLGMPPMQEFQQLNYAKKTVQSIQPVPHRRVKLTELKDKDKERSESDESSDTDNKNEILTLNSAFDSTNKHQDSTINLSSDLNEDKEEEESNDSDEIIVLDIEKRNLSKSSCKTKITFPLTNSNLSIEEKEDKCDQILNGSVIKLRPTGIVSDKETNKLNDKLSDKLSHQEIDKIINKATTNLTYETQDEERVKVDKEHKDNQNVTIDDNQNVDDKDSYKIEERRESTSSKITLVSMGAPVPASLNGEKPPLENFAVGMGELIYFENLPTSTGVFDKMRKVIKKIRKKLSNTDSSDAPNSSN